ncbi:BESS motif,MADF domain [Cinara cedri]|uniref:BESS motif,MADF domain n=1 Tax=Cinara cedri TaxID=506608 RepID=A0A5E4MZE4_9HEMI|nr:BESS motif,MADF domain [Cinara cedri]
MTFDAEKLIQEVKCRKAIWDMSSDEYSDQDLKRRQWEEITNIMCEKNLSENEKNIFGKSLQRKWKKIRRRFSKELKCLAGAKSGFAASRKSSYIFFQQLQFLRKTAVSNRTQASINEAGVLGGNEDLHLQIRSLVVQKKKKKDNENLVEVPKESIPAREDYERNRESDSDRLFLLSLLDDFKKIPDHHRLSTKIELMNVIKKAQNTMTRETQGYSQNVPEMLTAGSYGFRYGSEVSNNITMDNGQYHYRCLSQTNYGLGVYGPGTSTSNGRQYPNSIQQNHGQSPGTSSSGQNSRVHSTPFSDMQNGFMINYDDTLSATYSDISTVSQSSDVIELFDE